MSLIDSKQIEIWAEQCAFCKKKMEFKVTPILGETISHWILHATCTKCERIFFLSIFDREPKRGLDYILKDGSLKQETLVPHKEVVERLKQRLNK